MLELQSSVPVVNKLGTAVQYFELVFVFPLPSPA